MSARMALTRQVTALPKPVRFAALGLFVTGLHYLILRAGVAGGLPVIVANPLAFALAFCVSYAGNSRIFGASGARAAGLMVSGYLGIMGINTALLAGLDDFVGLTPAFVLATGFCAVLSYLWNRHVAFRR
ncbi:GtrA family protein [Parvularcula oceani]|uniref:GtrA family protein n=1 Tax=Parvularcula oceani TaxID=1247963 RepID=UPI0004E1DBFD|nr:GtrA family protein [Parvularcula oceani]